MNYADVKELSNERIIEEGQKLATQGANLAEDIAALEHRLFILKEKQQPIAARIREILREMFRRNISWEGVK